MSAPCADWTTPEEVVECCPGASGTDAAEYEDAVAAASELLYLFSARQFSGLCERTVRPCSSGLECGVQILSRGHVVTWDGSIWIGPEGAPSCSCSGVSRVVLPNWPVVEIEQVLIDGDVVPASGYRLDGKRYLTRMRDAEGNRQSWPRCQALDLDSSEDGTFEVTYTFGQEPPVSGVQAANQLACQIRLACASTAGAADTDCILPSGVTRITRQQVAIDFAAFRSWGFKRGEGWRTGMALVDVFLNAYNPSGLRSRPLIWSPDATPFAEEVGTVGGS
jgi:hypothetical protein